MFLDKKQSPDDDLKKLAAGLQASASRELRNITVFGSFASGEFHPGHSDVNVLVVLEPLNPSVLIRFQKTLSAWTRAGHLTPIFVSLHELPVLARTHPIEFVDMKDHHRLLFGDDVLTMLVIDMQGLRFQVKHDLSQLLLKLRRRYASIGEKPKALKSLMMDSIPSGLALFRAALRLQENVPVLSKIEAAERLAARVGVDPILLRRLAKFRFERKSDNVQGLMTSYLEAIEKVRQHLETI